MVWSVFLRHIDGPSTIRRQTVSFNLSNQGGQFYTYVYFKRVSEEGVRRMKRYMEYHHN